MSNRGLSLSFRSAAVEDGTLLVSSIVGEEGLSRLFRFEVELVSQEANLEVENLLYTPARLGFRHRLSGYGESELYVTRWVGGVLESFTAVSEEQGWVRYRAVLVPQLWHLTQSFGSRVFLDANTNKNVSELLEAAGLATEHDFEFLTEAPEREYVVQYEETDFAFMSRWLEREGTYYYFTNEGDLDKVVFTARSNYTPVEGQTSLRYLPGGTGAAGADGRSTEDEEVVLSFTFSQARLPAEVAVNDYNWRIPSVELHSSKVAHPRGVGVRYLYNEHFKTFTEGREVAATRVEQLKCRERAYEGQSNCAGLRPGHTFQLTGHFRVDCNQEYVVTGVRHEAKQGIALGKGGAHTGATYTNSFRAMPAEQIFLPPRTTPWPRLRGVMNARVDAEGDGLYSELDELGRYKVEIPFDQHRTSRLAGKASRYMRMAQPYAGQDSGLHFPLRKGTEVLLIHVDGDPDRPIIASAVPNPETQSPITALSQTSNKILTPAGNRFQMNDDRDYGGLVFNDSAGARLFATRGAARPRPAAESGGGGGMVAPGSGTAGDDSQSWKDATGWGDQVAQDAGFSGFSVHDSVKKLFDMATPTKLDTTCWPASHGSLTMDWTKAVPPTTSSHLLSSMTADEITRVTVGNHYSIEVSDLKLTYNHVENDITIVMKDAYTFSLHEGPYTSETQYDGKVIERTYYGNGKETWEKVDGNVTATSKVVGKVVNQTVIEDDEEDHTECKKSKATSETIWGAHSETTMRMGAFNENTLTLAAVNENSVTAGASIGVELFGGVTVDNSVTLGVAISNTVSLVGVMDNTLTVGAAVENTVNGGLAIDNTLLIGGGISSTVSVGLLASNTIALIGMVDTTIVVGAAHETTIVLGLSSEFALFGVAKIATEVYVGVQQDNALRVGLHGELSVCGAGAWCIDLVAGLRADVNISAAGAVEINMGIETKVINVPKQMEIDLEKLTVALGTSGINLKDTSLTVSEAKTALEEKKTAFNEIKNKLNQQVNGANVTELMISNARTAMNNAQTQFTKADNAITHATNAGLIKMG